MPAWSPRESLIGEMNTAAEDITALIGRWDELWITLKVLENTTVSHSLLLRAQGT